MESSGKNVISVGSSETTLGSQNINWLAWYSSRGPVYDQRFKPDLAAPGDQLMSAKSNGQGGQSCNTVEMTGTSMASPAAAGAALLVRQYFMDTNKRFWTKACNVKYNSCKVFTPSGALVKAILLHSGSALTVYENGNTKTALGNPPDYYQGFGRITLMNALPLQGTTNFDLFVDDAVLLGANSQKAYAVKLNVNNVASGTPIKVTVTWYDPPNVDGTTSKALLNDLDLKIVSPYGDVYYPNGKNVKDSLNNNEKIVINNPKKGAYKVTVTSKALPAGGSQKFSIVITSSGTTVYA
jgi:hypothetical protein